MSRLLIENPLLVATMNDSGLEFRGGHILIEDSVIRSIGSAPFEGQADEVIDARQMLVLPGFVNTHHHLFQALTRNVPAMQESRLFQWLVNHYQVWRHVGEEAVHTSARTALLEMMKSGVTTSSDHHYLFPHQAEPTLIDAEIRAAQELGIRFQPTRGSMSLGVSSGGLPPDDIVQDESAIQQDIHRLLAFYHDPAPGAMLRLAIAPCSPFNVTPESLRWTADFCADNELRMHTHIAETLDEERFCLETFGQRPIAYMDSLGWMRPDAWFAHCIHLNDDEIGLMGERGVGVAHCPDSNMRLGSGIARIRELLDAGAAVGLAVDGTASNDSGNMLMAVRNAMLLSRLREDPYWLTARDALYLATRGGARALGRDEIGQLAPGKYADLALFRMDRIEYAGGMADPRAALVFSVRMAPVDWLVINGQVRIREGVSEVDELALVEQHNRLAGELLARAREHSGFDDSSRANSQTV